MSTRWFYAGLSAQTVRLQLQCSLQEAARLVFLHSLMAELEDAKSVAQLKAQLMTYIEWKERL